MVCAYAHTDTDTDTDTGTGTDTDTHRRALSGSAPPRPVLSCPALSCPVPFHSVPGGGDDDDGGSWWRVVGAKGSTEAGKPSAVRTCEEPTVQGQTTTRRQ